MTHTRIHENTYTHTHTHTHKHTHTRMKPYVYHDFPCLYCQEGDDDDPHALIHTHALTHTHAHTNTHEILFLLWLSPFKSS